MGGNIANGSPIGDSAPVLMALDAQLELRQGERVRRLPLHDFYTGYLTNRPGGRRVRPGHPDRAGHRVRRAGSARTRSASVSTPTSRRCSRRWPIVAGRRPRGRRAPRLRRPRRGRQACRHGRSRAARTALQRRDARRRRKRRWRATSRRWTTCAGERGDIACAWRRTCCSGSGWKHRPTPSRAPSRRRSGAWHERRALDPLVAWRRTEPLPKGSGIASLREEDLLHPQASWRRRTARAAASPSQNARARFPMTGTAPRLLEPPHASAGVGSPRPHESAHLHVAGSGHLHRRHPRARRHTALRRSDCRPSRTAALRAMHLDRIRALPGVVDVFAAVDIPGHNDCGPILHDDPILADGDAALPRAAGVRRRRAHTRADARRAAAKAREVLDIEPLEAVLTPRDAHARKACYVIPTIHLVARHRSRAAPRRRSPRRRTASPTPSRSADRNSSTSKGRSATPSPSEDDGMKLHCSTQHPSEMQHLVAHALGPAVASRARGVPAHGRRLRRQGVAVGAVRVRRGARGEAH